MQGLINYDKEAGRYQSGRGLSYETLDGWRRTVTEFLPSGTSPTVLDLGAGTGIFTRAWHNWCGSRVVAVEPSEGMRTEASKVGAPIGSAYVAGIGESLALLDASIDIAWLSTVLHHFRDQDACASELGRVVVPGGVLLIRGLFSDAGQIGWLDSFPGDEVRASMPSVAGTVSMFERYGFRQIGLREVIGGERETAGESAAWVRMMRTADTLLASFSDDDFRAGLANLENLPADQPMTHSLALLALSKGPKRSY
jgi:SAM-dependent methyltransferase